MCCCWCLQSVIGDGLNGGAIASQRAPPKLIPYREFIPSSTKYKFAVRNYLAVRLNVRLQSAFPVYELKQNQTWSLLYS